MSKDGFHLHEVKPGFMVRCYHKSKSILLNWQFWLGTFAGFPLEHFFWEHVPPFLYLTHLLHL